MICYLVAMESSSAREGTSGVREVLGEPERVRSTTCFAGQSKAQVMS
jgi:hypothetical protein